MSEPIAMSCEVSNSWAHPMPPAAWNNLRVLVPLLATSIVVTNLAAVVAVEHGSNLLDILRLALATSQISLMSTWLALGKYNSRPLAIALLLATISFWTISIRTPADYTTEYVVACFLLAGMVFACLRMLPGRRFQMANTGRSDKGAACLVAGNFRWQFPLSRLFLWTTWAATALLAMRLLAEEPFRWLSLVWTTAPFVALSLLAVWVSLSERTSCWRMLLLLGLSAHCGLVAGHWYPALACGLHSLLIVSYLYVFRVAGFRLAGVKLRQATPQWPATLPTAPRW